MCVRVSQPPGGGQLQITGTQNAKKQTRNSVTFCTQTRNSVTFGSNSLRCLGPHIWNSLPENIKEITSFEKFKESINNWYGPSCKCSLCHYNN